MAGQEERARTWEQAKALLDRENEGRALEAEEREQYERMAARLGELDARIDELHDLNVANRKAEAAREQYESVVAPEVRTAREDAETRAWTEFLQGKRSHIDLDFRGMGVQPAEVGRAFEVRDLLKDVAASGGNTVPTSFVRSLYEHMVENSK